MILQELLIKFAEFLVGDVAQPLAGVVESLGHRDVVAELLIEINKEGAAGDIFDAPEAGDSVAGSAAEAGADEADVFVV